MCLCTLAFGASTNEQLTKLDTYFSQVRAKTTESLKAFNQIKIIYIDAILSNDKIVQKFAIERLIDGSQILNIAISSEYYKELANLNKQNHTQPTTYPKRTTKVTEPPPQNTAPLAHTALSQHKTFYIRDMYLKDNTLYITGDPLEESSMQESEWNSNKRYRKIFDIQNATWNAQTTKRVQLGSDKFATISQYKKNIVRVVVNDKEPHNLELSLENGYLTITDNTLVKTKQQTTIVPTRANLSNNLLNQSIIVIDPGHGGKDSGAIGKKGSKVTRIYEKDIVLSISRMVYDKLKASGYKKIYLTRNNDKYIELTKRTAFANDKKADLFISIHANASESKKTQGIETYFLSPARSARAKKAAERENDRVVQSLNFSSKNIFLDVLNKSKILASNKLAIDIHKNVKYNILKQYKKSIDHGVRSGPFWILVGSQMPSVLVEVGYVTSAQEAKRLKSISYQNSIATGIADGITNYLKKN